MIGSSISHCSSPHNRPCARATFALSCKQEVCDDVLLLPTDESRSMPVQGADMSDVPAMREPLRVHSETEGAGVCQAQAAR
jgi:hypothetical protein